MILFKIYVWDFVHIQINQDHNDKKFKCKNQKYSALPQKKIVYVTFFGFYHYKWWPETIWNRCKYRFVSLTYCDKFLQLITYLWRDGFDELIRSFYYCCMKYIQEKVICAQGTILSANITSWERLQNILQFSQNSTIVQEVFLLQIWQHKQLVYVLTIFIS